MKPFPSARKGEGAKGREDGGRRAEDAQWKVGRRKDGAAAAGAMADEERPKERREERRSGGQ